MKTARLILHTLLLCLAVPFTCRAEHLVDLLPEGSQLVLSAADVKRLQELPDHKVAKLIATPQMRKAFAPLLSGLEEGLSEVQTNWKQATGLEVKEVLAMFNGGASMGVSVSKLDRIKEFATLPPTEDNMQGVIALEFSGDEAVATKIMEAFLKWEPDASDEDEDGGDEDEKDSKKKPKEKLKFPDDYTEEVEEDGGTKLHIWLPKKETSTSSPSAWALVNKVLLFTNGEKTLRTAIEKVRHRADAATNQDGTGVLSLVKNADAFAYIQMRPWVGNLIDQAMEKAKQNARPGAMDDRKMMQWFGIHKIEAAYVTADFKNEAVDLEVGVAFPERVGLQKLIATPGPGTAPDFLPPDATSGGYGTFSLGDIMDAAFELIAEASPPMKAMISTKLDDMRRQSGVDLRKDILGNLGPDVWNVTGNPVASLADQLKKEEENKPPTPEPQVIGFRIKDRRAVELALSNLLNWATPGQPLFEKQDYQGFELNQFKMPTVPLAYLVTDDWFMLAVGPRVMLEKVLSRLKKGGGGNHLFAQPHVAAAIRALPEGGHSTSYTDLGALLESFITLLQTIPAGEVAFEDILDIDELPKDLDLPLAAASRLYNEDRALRIRFHIEEKARP